MPVRNYSSGMKVRLGFAVAAQMEPDVLIIDEVLAVGDLGFVLKCFKTIDTILPNTAIIFVSHSMPMVSRICTQIILMDKGNAKFQGEDVSKAIDLYYTRFANNGSTILFSDNSIELEHAIVISEEVIDGIPQIKWLDDLIISIKLKLNKEIDSSFSINLIIFDKEQRPVALMKDDRADFTNYVNGNVLTFKFIHKKLLLSKGTYSMNISVAEAGSTTYRANTVLEFQVLHEQEIWQPFLLDVLTSN